MEDLRSWFKGTIAPDYICMKGVWLAKEWTVKGILNLTFAFTYLKSPSGIAKHDLRCMQFANSERKVILRY
jgi:hypothetical protein